MKKIALIVLAALLALSFLTLALLNAGDPPLSDRARELLNTPVLPQSESSKVLHAFDKSPWAPDTVHVIHQGPLSVQWKNDERYRGEVEHEKPAIEKYKQILEMGELVEPPLSAIARPKFGVEQSILVAHKWLLYSLSELAAEGKWKEVEHWIQLENRLALSFMRQTSLLGVMIANVMLDNDANFLFEELRLNNKLKFSKAVLDSFQSPEAAEMMRFAMLGEFRFVAEFARSDDSVKALLKDQPWPQRLLAYLPLRLVYRPNELINREADLAFDILPETGCWRPECYSSVRWAHSDLLRNPAGKLLLRYVSENIFLRYDKLKIRTAERAKVLKKLRGSSVATVPN